jgi:predicted porin
MQKSVLTSAVTLALATFGAGAAFAQSSLTIYGSADVSIDNVHKTAGVRLIPADARTQATDSTVTRVSPSATSQTAFGFKGTEDLGGGMKASFVLEGQLSHDTGALSQDGRIFGRQSYVGLTTPVGEIRLGRQYAPIFYSTAFVTGERFGATDLFIEGGATNNLQVRQDNQVSYWVQAGGFTGSIAYSPNAGSLSKVSAARGAAASTTNGGILGSAGSGSEAADNTGRALGAFGNYAFSPNFNVTLGLHRNLFGGAQFGIYSAAANATTTSTFRLERYDAANVGAKYTFENGIMIDGAFGQGRYDFTTSDSHMRLRFFAIGTRIPVNQWTFSAQASQIKFSNFTQGKDTGLMLGAEYALSKRTSLFARAVQIRDDEGKAADAGVGAPIQGGPDVIATAFGFRETPVFAGAGINPGGTARYVGAGIRHSF